jgi:hypothetical protein
MCAICNHRPRANGSRYCTNCQARLDKEKRLRKAEKPVKFATYQGYVVGFYRNGDGMLAPRLLRRKPENLPRSRTLDLNHYIEGFTRAQVKRIKTVILQLASS